MSMANEQGIAADGAQRNSDAIRSGSTRRSETGRSGAE